MLVVVTYDVNTTTEAGATRLRHVAKLCERFGRRVQNSVFECSVDAAQLRLLQAELTALIDPKTDSLRFYSLGNHYQTKVQHIGAHPAYQPDDVLMV